METYLLAWMHFVVKSLLFFFGLTSAMCVRAGVVAQSQSYDLVICQTKIFAKKNNHPFTQRAPAVFPGTTCCASPCTSASIHRELKILYGRVEQRLMKEHAHFVVAFSLHFLVFDDFSKQNKIPTSFLTTTPFPPVAPPPRCDNHVVAARA